MEADMKSEQRGRRILGRCPDLVVMGRTLREWAEGDLGDSTSELGALRDAVVRVTGMDFADAVGPTMVESFNERFEDLVAMEAEEGRYAVFEEGARILGHPEAEVISVIHVRASSAREGRHLAVAGIGDRRVLFGRVDGMWREFEFETLFDGACRKAVAC